jgi:hypothetical protein
MSDSIVVHANNNEPVVFTQDELGWLPWLGGPELLAEEAMDRLVVAFALPATGAATPAKRAKR